MDLNKLRRGEGAKERVVSIVPSSLKRGPSAAADPSWNISNVQCLCMSGYMEAARQYIINTVIAYGTRSSLYIQVHKVSSLIQYCTSFQISTV